MFDLLVTWYFLAGVSNLLLVTIPSVCVVNGVCVCVCLPSPHVAAAVGWQVAPERSSLEFRSPRRHRLPETLAHRSLPPSAHTPHTPCLWLYCKHTHKWIYISKTERRGKSTSCFLFSCCSLVIDEVLRIQEFSQKLIVTFQDLIGEKCEVAADWRETKLLLEKN